MLRFLPYIVVSAMVYIGLIYMQTYQPEELNQLIIKMDVFGITESSKYEHWRLDRIKRLDGANALQKQVLINHTVFIGATAEMVEYALGPPKLTNHPDKLLYYIYFIQDDKRPTVFEFACNNAVPECNDPYHHKDIFILKRAFKMSTIDLGDFKGREN